MATKQTIPARGDLVDWTSIESIKARVAPTKSAVTRACTAIAKLSQRSFNYSTPAVCNAACKQLQDAFYFCVAVHERLGDLF